MAAYIFTRQILAHKAIKVFNHGNMRRDFTYIDDVVSGVLAALERPPVALNGEPPIALYNLGNSHAEDLMRFIAVLEDSLGTKAIIDLQPLQPGDVTETFADIASSTCDLGFCPLTAIEQGIPQFVAWYRSYHKG